MSERYKIGDRLEVEVVKIIPNGLGLCFAEKLTLFVPLSAPGDRLVVEIADLRGRTAFAKILKVLEESPERSAPECRYFGECGGCDFQHLTYEAQLGAKLEIIRDCLKRIAKIEEEPEISIVPCPEPYGYRLRTQVHADPHSKEIGFYKRQSHDVIEAESCPILVPGLDETIADIRSSFDWSNTSLGTINIEAGFAGGKASVYSEEIFQTVNELEFEASGFRYGFDARSFFQANKFMVGPLIEEAVRGHSGDLAIDLYCGIGLFTLPLARSFGSVIGVESSMPSFRFAEKNAQTAGLENAVFVNSRVKRFLQAEPEKLSDADLVLVDPPRSGVKGAALKMIANAAPKRITYVSCDPSTLARDVRLLIDNGYEIDRFTAVDLFPQTHHVEAVVHLSIDS